MNDDNKGGGDNRDPDNVLSSAEMRRAAVAQVSPSCGNGGSATGI